MIRIAFTHGSQSRRPLATRRVITGRAFIAALSLAGALGCNRETRDIHGKLAADAPAPFVHTTAQQPGAQTRAVGYDTYQENRWAVSEGMRLYNGFNCVGCHANGGGGIGPPLADDKWIYGSAPEQIFSTIMEGRPNGMPAFGGKIENPEVWKLVAYVRALGHLTSADTWPARGDHMSEASPVGNGK